MKIQLITCEDNPMEPSAVYEKARRKLESNFHFFWDYVRATFFNLRKTEPDVAHLLKEIVDTARDYKM